MAVAYPHRPGAMSHLGDVLARALADFSELGSHAALVGGLAVSARAEPRFTRDVDLAVYVRSDHDAEQLVRALLERGYGVLAQVEHAATGRLATVRLAPPGEGALGVVVDLLFASSGIEPELVAAAETLEVMPGLTVPVARLAHLLAMKILSYDDATRPQDRIDLVALLEEASPADLSDAQQALALITERGFDRGRDLQEELRRLSARQ